MAALSPKQVRCAFSRRGGVPGLLLSFGPFTVDLVRKTVTKHGAPLRLTLKCTDLLVALAQSPGRALNKEELIEAAWGGPDVSDATLAQHIFLLRRELRDTDLRIATVRGVGYCFDAVVTRAGRDDARERSRDRYVHEAQTFRDFGTESGLRSAIELYGRAIALQPSDAHAYAGRAACRRLLAESMYADPLAALNGARGDAASALACDPENVDARIESAFACALRDRDFHAAEAHRAAAHMLEPAHPLVAYLSVWLPLLRGSLDEALHASCEYGGSLAAMALYFARRYTQARGLFARAAEDPTARMMVGACMLFEGDAAAAASVFRAVYTEDVDLRHGAVIAARLYALALYVYALGKSGDWLEARKTLAHIEKAARNRYVSPMVRAIAYMGLGERTVALQLIEEAAEHLDPWSTLLRIDPIMDELRGDPRFDALARRLAA